MSLRNPLLTREYYQSLRKFNQQHGGAIPRVIQTGSINTEIEERRVSEEKAARKRRRSQGRSAPAVSRGESPAQRSHKPSNGSGVGEGMQPGNSPSDCDAVTMSRAAEAPPMRVDEDR